MHPHDGRNEKNLTMTRTTTTTTMFHGMTTTKGPTHHLDLPSSSSSMSPVHTRPAIPSNILSSSISTIPHHPTTLVTTNSWVVMATATYP